MPVDSPRQNKHGWWGTLTIDPDTEPKADLKGLLENRVPCVFIKTSKESHYLTAGTLIKRVRLFTDFQVAKNALSAYFSSNPGIEEDLRLISSEYPNVTTFVEILELDDAKTNPLAKKLNEYTRQLFAKEIDSDWLEQNKDKAGKNDIEAGMNMPLLKDL